MCGIVGEYLYNKRFKDSKHIELMLSKIKSRGPDYSGFSTNDSISLGHSRLSIIDLSPASNQPFIDDKTQLKIVFNGCIYNYIALRKILIKKGHIFKSTGDTEVVIKSYIEWGSDCLQKFEGDFAFAIWEKGKDKLFIARDRFGVKPLYYVNLPDCFRFGSTLQSLLVKNDIPMDLDAKSLHLHFSFHASIPAPNTIFKNIRKLSPGSYMVVEKGKPISIKKYWELKNLEKQSQIHDADDAKALIEEMLFKSIEKRIDAADTDVGVLLSGGLDSSLIVGLTKNKFNNIKTYSIGFEDDIEEKGSEFFYSDMIAEKFKTQHKKYVIKNNDVLFRLSEAFENMSEPMVAQDAVAFFLLSEKVSNDIKVVLSGQGADEVFGGYFWYQKILNEQNNYKNFLKHYVDRSHKEINEFLNHNFNKDYTSHYVNERFNKIKGDCLISKVLNLDVTTLIVDDPVKRVDNMTMAWGLEARVPFLDHLLVESAFRIAPELHLARDGKNILKKIADEILPNDIIDRKKGYFPMPALKFIRGEFYDFIYDILSSNKCYNRNLYNRPYIDRLLQKPNEHKTAIEGNKLWHAAATELWLQQNLNH